MGNKISRDQRLLIDLQKRITQLEKIDQNSDGLVSKEEYTTWTKEQETHLQLFKETVLKIRDAEHQVAIQRLQNEINTLRRVNVDLESRLTNKNPRTAGTVNTKLFGELSRAYIDEEINKLLANVDVNVNIIPDYYERMIYRNIFNMFFGLIENLTNNASIKFLNHTVSFNITADSKIKVSRDIGNVKSTADDDTMVDAAE